jgi:hypothetical protein
VPALKFPEASLATTVETVLALVAFEVTVKVEAPEPLYVVEPDIPVPEVFSVRVFKFDPRAMPEIVEFARLALLILAVPLRLLLVRPVIPEPDPENDDAVTIPVALTVVALRNPTVETPVALILPANPPLAVILVKVAVVPERVGIVAAAPTLIVVACKNASVETPVALTLPVTLPVKAAVIVPALKFPDASLATIADAVLALVALLVTVKVAAPELLNVVEPDNPVPEVFRVNVFAKEPENDDAVQTPVALTVVALRNPTVETPVEFMLPDRPPLAVILVKVAVVPERVGIVAAALTFTVVACKNAAVETPVEFMLPVMLPVNAAVIVPALKFPEPSLATTVETVFAEVALLVTVKVAGEEPSYVVEPDNPVPEVFRVKVLTLAVGVDQVPSPLKNVEELGVPLPPSLAAVIIPEDMLDAFRVVRDAPEPENEVAVTIPTTLIPFVAIVTPEPTTTLVSIVAVP